MINRLEEEMFHSNIDPLLRNLQRSSDHLREEAAFELRHAGGIRVIEALIMALGDPVERVRAVAAESLSMMGWKNREIIAPSLVPLLDDTAESVQLAASKALGKLWTDQAVERMIELLDSPNRQIRVYAAIALGRTKNTRAMSALAKNLLQEKDKRVRAALLIGLGQAGNKKVVPLLIKSGLSDLDRRVRASAVESLGQFNYTDKERFQIINIIRKHIQGDQDNRVLGNAIITLHRLGDLDALTPLAPLIKSSNKWDRASAAYVCGIIANPETTDFVFSLVRDSDVDVRLNVVRAMARIATPRTIDWLVRFMEDADDMVRRETFLIFPRIKEKRVAPAVNKLLAERNEVIRYLAAQVVRNISDPSSLPFLLAALIKEKNPEIKAVLIQTATRIAHETPLSALECFGDQLVRDAQKMALELTAGCSPEHRQQIKNAAMNSRWKEVKQLVESLS